MWYLFGAILVRFWLPIGRFIYQMVIWVEERPLAHRQAREEAGLCEAYGYDMRATPRQCPECGYRTTPTSRMSIERPIRGARAGGQVRKDR